MNTIPIDEPTIIHTYNPEQEIWHYISKLTSLSYTIQLLRERIEKQFFGLDIPGLMNIKKQNIELLNRNSDREEQNTAELHEPISNNGDVNTNAEEISHTIRQAIELYNALQTLSLYAKPILLYYCYNRLARVLFLATYKHTKRQKGSGNHGLKFDGDDIVCQRMGAFARFQDSYFTEPSIYLDHSIFRWEDLLQSPTDRFYLLNNMAKGNDFATVRERKTKREDYRMHELSREFLFTYALSMLSRYSILKWNEIIEGKDSEVVWKIQDYLRSTQYLFPNYVFNKLHGQRYLFYPESRMSP